MCVYICYICICIQVTCIIANILNNKINKKNNFLSFPLIYSQVFFLSDFLIYVIFLLFKEVLLHFFQGRFTGNKFPQFLSV